MTAANNGTSTPEDDDPFGYLYEDGQAAGAVPPRSGGYGYPGPASQPGVPRTSYNQVRTVGERQYGQQQHGQYQQQYGQQVPQQQAHGQQNYSQPNAHYAAPETQPGGAPTRPVAHSHSGGVGGRGGGPNTKGLLIGAVAVVAVVVIGIGIALLTSNNDDAKGTQAGDTGGGGTSTGETVKPSEDPKDEPKEPAAKLPKKDAALLQLSPGLSTDKTVPGARSSSGAYVPLNTPGASATWTVKVPKAGAYTLSIDYGVPGKDAKTSLTVNGKPHGGGLNMKNFAHAEEGAWDKGWTNTFAWVNLTKGENTFVISCGQGDQCEANLDRLELKAGHIQ
ncbi:CBM35 domain-containing protein [Streptomyces albidochromogenes]|uniref:carbohydrate-binding protein n=1 Tax=Streptomyces albidochromogenes TaxID=329524 RepID=UPI00110FB8B8|nr:carbohydrate-binding protein [Streptomyces albidochromogenes]